MREMIERVARAIYNGKLLVQPREPWQDGKANVTEIFCMQTARAAIEAMREPTESMLVATDVVFDEDIPLPQQAWRMMIDNILSEPSGRDLESKRDVMLSRHIRATDENPRDTIGKWDDR